MLPVFLQMFDNEFGNMLRQYVLGAKLNDAGPLGPGQRQNSAKIQVVGKEDKIVNSRVLDKQFVFGVRRADMRPMNRFDIP